MARLDGGTTRPPRRWGNEPPPIDDDEARRRLLEATSRCIVRRGSAEVRMAEVADEAGVARSTLYRYFPTRSDLITGLMLSRTGVALERIVGSLPHPDDAARSLPDLILEPIGLVDGSPLNEALFSPESSPFVIALELGSEVLLDELVRHYGALLEAWQRSGQLHHDLDIRETARWMNAISLVLLAPPWRQRSRVAKQEFLERYFVRAVVVTVV